ncbi:MAG: hypothetical protein WAV55_01455 [Clostridiaceae bacterium]
MNEVRRKSLIRKMDLDWLNIAASMVSEEESVEDEEYVEDKELLVGEILKLREKLPGILLFLLHHGVISRLLNHCGTYLGMEVEPEEVDKIRKNIITDLKTVSDKDYLLPLPNHALETSAAFAELLVIEGILPELLLEWSDETQGYISTAVIATEIWNLVNYYGVITPADLLRLHSASHGEEEALDEEIMGIIQGYIEMNLSDQLFFEEINGEDYLLSEYMGIEPEAILEDIKNFDGDYYIVGMESLMDMQYGITPLELLTLMDYINTSFEVNDEIEALLTDVEFLHTIIVTLRGRGARYMPKYFHEELGWEWAINDKESREFLFQDLLNQMPRFQLKGHSVAELDGEEEDEYDEEELFFEDDIPEEFKFKMRKPKPDDDQFLN